jgi:hypothetical protein
MWMQAACQAVVTSIPDARLTRLDGQSHMVKAKATAPAVAAFLAEITSAARPASGPRGAER